MYAEFGLKVDEAGDAMKDLLTTTVFHQDHVTFQQIFVSALF